jgi:hypothetical protein
MMYIALCVVIESHTELQCTYIDYRVYSHGGNQGLICQARSLWHPFAANGFCAHGIVFILSLRGMCRI